MKPLEFEIGNVVEAAVEWRKARIYLGHQPEQDLAEAVDKYLQAAAEFGTPNKEPEA